MPSTTIIAMSIVKRKGVKVKCSSCGHSWVYLGRLKKATCSNCSNKTKIGDKKW